MSAHTSAVRPLAWEYLNSREFIASYDLWAQTYRKNYSRRAFAKWARIKSPNFLTLVIHGKRSLRNSWLTSFARAAQLKTHEAAYLQLMVKLEKGLDSTEQLKILNQMHEILEKHRIRSEAAQTLSLIRRPLAWDLLQMSDLVGASWDAKWFRRRLRRAASVPEIRECLELLRDNGLIAQTKSNGIEVIERHLTTPDQVQKAENARFHEYVLNEGLEVLATHTAEERSFGSLTLSVTESRIDDLKREISTFGKSLIRKYGESKSVDGEVFRMNIQLYSLTQSKGTDK